MNRLVETAIILYYQDRMDKPYPFTYYCLQPSRWSAAQQHLLQLVR